MTFSQRLLWQLCSAVLLLLSLDLRVSGSAQAQEQAIILEPGLDVTLNQIQYISTEPTSPRHVAEKKRLLETLKRPDGNELPKDHPRYRLLQAMHGYLRHQERYIAQLTNWEKSYSDLPEAQKKVSTLDNRGAFELGARSNIVQGD